MTQEDESQTEARSALFDAVYAHYDNVEDPRMRQVLKAAVKHLHSFIYDVEPSPDEWRSALGFLADVGKACTDKRQEFGLLSDLLGASTAVDHAGYAARPGETPSSVEGPFYVEGSPDVPVGGSILLEKMEGGVPTIMRGTVRSGDGQPVPGAVVDVWQTAPNQLYAVTDDAQSDDNLRGRIRADDRGYYEFHTIKPVPYCVPTNGPCGLILRAVGGHGMRAAHIHVRVEAPGFKTLVTQVFPQDDPYLESDTVFGVAGALVTEFAPTSLEGEDALLVDFDFVLSRP